MAMDEEEQQVATKESIIIETNFKIYAYTKSPLEIAILNLFVHFKTRFANMVCGQITRESIRNALYNGITADQIIKFLETHAHPQMRILAKEKLDKKLNSIPVTISILLVVLLKVKLMGWFHNISWKYSL